MNNYQQGIIAIIGGGPAALFTLKHILKKKLPVETIYIFEKNERLGAGMPYGNLGSSKEHVANVSSNELPELIYSFENYISRHQPEDFQEFVKEGKINPYEVIPRLLLGNYLEDQFNEYIKLAKKEKIEIIVSKNTCVTDIIKISGSKKQFKIKTDKNEIIADKVILCTGHFWPKKYEEKVSGWFDSPYPPSKFSGQTNFPVAVRGTSLTAVDAIKTIARLNGEFISLEDGKIQYRLNKNSEKFKIEMFSTGGFLPALRFHSEEDPYSSDWTMSLQEIYDYKKNHGGFVDLDYVFEINFKLPLKKKDPEFYNSIKDLSIEEFVDKMLGLRERTDSFDLFKAEYAEAEKSIKKRQSITWKEKLAAFSYAMNYPAKHFSAEDMLRLKSTLMPLISIIIASLPQSSYKEIMALYDSGIISLTQVDNESKVEPHPESGGIYFYKSENGKNIQKHYQMFVDAIGQQQMNVEDLPFEGLRQQQVISPGFLKFKSSAEGKNMHYSKKENVVEGNDQYYLQVPGLGINDYFQSLNLFNESVENLFIMAVPFIGGLNPDYSGLDFCDTAAEKIAEALECL